jgi:hypothetical protein
LTDTQRLLAETIALRDAETDKRKRKQLSQRVKLLRSVRDWERTVLANRAEEARG